MEDIAPGLIDAVTKEFHRLYDGSAKINALLEKVKAGAATYAEAQEYSLEVSRLIGVAYEKHISPAVLPDGRMYYNIASRLIPATLDENHSLVADYAAKVQKALNEKANIGLAVQKAPIDSDRVDGLVELAASEEYAKVEQQLQTAFDGFCQSVVDETIRRNADLHHNAGLSPKIIRRSTGKCCDWCRALVGIHRYPVERKIYQRHANCRCTVLYDPADGSKSMQNVYTKRWTDSADSDTIEVRRKVGLSNLDTFRPKDQHNTIQKYVGINRADVAAAAKAGKRHSGVYVDAMGKKRKQLQRSIINRIAEVERHADKIQHPEKYIPDWGTLDPRYQAGLLRKWEKDMRRNAEQAEIELSVFEERYGR